MLGPLLFTAYMIPLGDIIRRYNIQHHFYADDTQLYFSLNNPDPIQSVTSLDECVCSVKKWMTLHMLKLNEGKTEMIMFTPRSIPSPTVILNLCGIDITSSLTARNLGVKFDNRMSFESHINKICQSSYIHLRYIARIRKNIPQNVCESIIHAFISSRLDSCNSLLYDLPDTLIAKLQRIQNAAARILTGTKRFEHITPILKALYWLPIRQRISYKLAVTTFKCIKGQAPPYLCNMINLYQPSTQPEVTVPNAPGSRSIQNQVRQPCFLGGICSTEIVELATTGPQTNKLTGRFQTQA